jgi:hypothetical protein
MSFSEARLPCKSPRHVHPGLLRVEAVAKHGWTRTVNHEAVVWTTTHVAESVVVFLAAYPLFLSGQRCTSELALQLVRPVMGCHRVERPWLKSDRLLRLHRPTGSTLTRSPDEALERQRACLRPR